MYTFNSTMSREILPVDNVERVKLALKRQAEKESKSRDVDVNFLDTNRSTSSNFMLTDIDALYEKEGLASAVITDNLIRPVITDRSDAILKNKEEPVQDFIPFSPSSKDNWLESFSHKKA